MASQDTTPVPSPRSTPIKSTFGGVSSRNTPPMTPPSPGFNFPPLERNPSSASSSGSSTAGTSSTRSSLARGDPMTRRRGFMRPQGTEFSTSARSRESVMALGSIAHLQYFFAKTGLLDGKGAGLQTKKSSSNLTVDTTSLGNLQDSTYSSLRSSPELLLPGEHDFFSESPSGMHDDFSFDDSIMLPPTTSTYNPQTKHIAPTPNPQVLRERLRGALAVTRMAWVQSCATPGISDNTEKSEGEQQALAQLPPGFQELQGNELVELATSAIRAAKAYYYTTDTSLLSRKDDKSLREEFLVILDVLRRMAQRKFDGGVKPEEENAVVKWIDNAEASLAAEEKAISDMRKQGRDWLEGNWKGREMDRYYLFMSYFDPSPEPLPKLNPDDTSLPTPFLSSLQTGLRLILIHNAVVRRSKRPFGQIPTYHTDFGKPYRLAENLRYWVKAAEIRWEIRLKFDVTAVVNGKEEGWRDFERDIGIWCARVMEEIRTDWEMGYVATPEDKQGGEVRQGRSGTLESLNVEVGGYRT